RRARVAAGFTITNAVKVIERSTPIVLKFRETIRNRNLLPKVPLGRPKGVFQRHRLNRYWCQLIELLGVRRASVEAGERCKNGACTKDFHTDGTKDHEIDKRPQEFP